MDIGYIILAGGKSLRLGRDKKQETVGGITLLERVISVLSLLPGSHGKITIVTDVDSLIFLQVHYPDLKIVQDFYPGKGSSGAIFTGLSFSGAFHNLVVACDMPFLNPDLLNYMIGIIAHNDIVAYRSKDNFEPLHAIYSKNCIIPLESIIQNNLRIIELVNSVKVRYLNSDEIERFDSENLSFFNVNTKADLRAAKLIAFNQSCGRSN